MTNEQDLIIALAGCSLAVSPGEKDNWIEKSGSGGKGGQLPEYICRIARAIMRSGKTRSQAISIAVSRVKKWSAGGDNVNADTRAKAAKAVAQWESMKAKNKAKKLVKMTRFDGETYLALSNTGEFSLTLVQETWQVQQNAARRELRLELENRFGPEISDISISDMIPFGWIREVWNNFLIVQYDLEGEMPLTFKVPFVVEGIKVIFDSPIRVTSEWVEESDVVLTSNERELLSSVLSE